MFEGQHEPIITEELWDASVRVRQRHQYRSRVLQTVSRPYLLSQLARCHVCGRNLRAQGLKSGGYYREMSYERGYDDCPNSKMGTRTMPCTRKWAALVRLLKLPTDWQAELAQMLGEDDSVTTLANRRARLTAERRRLKEAYLRGDFEEDEDLYRRALERIRRDMEQLPSEGDMVQIQQAAETCWIRCPRSGRCGRRRSARPDPPDAARGAGGRRARARAAALSHSAVRAALPQDPAAR